MDADSYSLLKNQAHVCKNKFYWITDSYNIHSWKNMIKYMGVFKQLVLFSLSVAYNNETSLWSM